MPKPSAAFETLSHGGFETFKGLDMNLSDEQQIAKKMTAACEGLSFRGGKLSTSQFGYGSLPFAWTKNQQRGYGIVPSTDPGKFFTVVSKQNGTALTSNTHLQSLFDFSSTSIDTHDPNMLVSSAVLNGVVVTADGNKLRKYYQSSIANDLIIIPPAPTFTLGIPNASTTGPLGNWLYRVTLVDANGNETGGGLISALASPVIQNVNLTINLTGFVANPLTEWRKVRFYRTENNGTTVYYFLTEINFIAGTTSYTYTDTLSDATIKGAGSYQLQNTTTFSGNNFTTRFKHTSLVFNNKMWIIGGQTEANILLNDVWSSSDGITWTQQTASAAFSARQNHTSIVFNNLMWVIGGNIAGGQLNDVWSSSDGITWTQVLANTASPGANQFSQRWQHASVVFNSLMWVIGGYDGTSDSNEAWSSPDGITWTKKNITNFTARHAHSVSLLGSSMYLIGGTLGGSNSPSLNDVWSSSDGITWTQVLANTASPGANQFSQRYEHASLIFNSLIFLIAGINGSGTTLNDVWSSSNGITWTQQTASAAFSARYAHTSVSSNNYLFLMGGVNSNANRLSDTWKSVDGITWQQTNFSLATLTANYLITFENRIFAINTTENGINYPNRVRWSDLTDSSGISGGNVNSWQQSSYVDVDTDVLNPAIGAYSGMGGRFYVYKPNATYALHPTTIPSTSTPTGFITTYVPEKIDSEYGFFHHSIASGGDTSQSFYSAGIIIGRTRDGLATFNGIKYTPMAKELAPLFKRCKSPMVDSAAFDFTYHRYYVAVCDSGLEATYNILTGTNLEFLQMLRNTIVCYDLTNNTFEVHSNVFLQVLKNLQDTQRSFGIFALGFSNDIFMITKDSLTGVSFSKKATTFSDTIIQVSAFTLTTNQLQNRKVNCPIFIDASNTKIYFTDYSSTVASTAMSGANAQITLTDPLPFYEANASDSYLIVVDSAPGNTVTSGASNLLTDDGNNYFLSSNIDNFSYFYDADGTGQVYSNITNNLTVASATTLNNSVPVPAARKYIIHQAKRYQATTQNPMVYRYFLSPFFGTDDMMYTKMFRYLKINLRGSGILRIRTFVDGKKTADQTLYKTLSDRNGWVYPRIDLKGTTGHSMAVEIGVAMGTADFECQAMDLWWRRLGRLRNA